MKEYTCACCTYQPSLVIAYIWPIFYFSFLIETKSFLFQQLQRAFVTFVLVTIAKCKHAPNKWYIFTHLCRLFYFYLHLTGLRDITNIDVKWIMVHLNATKTKWKMKSNVCNEMKKICEKSECDNTVYWKILNLTYLLCWHCHFFLLYK